MNALQQTIPGAPYVPPPLRAPSEAAPAGTIADRTRLPGFDLPVRSEPEPVQAEPEPDPLESDWSAGWAEGMALFRSGDTHEDMLLSDAYRPIIQALEDAGERDSNGGPLRNPGHYPVEMMTNATTRRHILPEVWVAIRRRRQVDPNFLPGVPQTFDEFHEQIRQRDAERLEAAQRRETSGLGHVTRFVGTMAGAMMDPVALYSLPFGGGGRTILQVGARSAVASGVIDLLMQPSVAQNFQRYGLDYGPGDAVLSVTTSTLGGGLVGMGMHAGAKGTGRLYDVTVAQVFNALPAAARERWASRMSVLVPGAEGPEQIPVSDFINRLGDRDAASFARDVLGPNLTPDERAAVNVLEREAEVRESSPFERTPEGDEAHSERLGEALRRLIDNAPARPDPSTADMFGPLDLRRPAAGVARGAGAGDPDAILRSLNTQMSGPRSGLRTPEQNEAVGGAANSHHLRGNARDIPLRDNAGNPLSKVKIREAFERGGYDVIELLGPGDKGHSDHFHVAFRPRGGGPGGGGQQPTAPRGSRGTGERIATGSRGERNNNPGNLEDGQFTRRQPGYVGTDGRFARFETREQGVAAQEQLLARNYLDEPRTVRQVIDKYAPAGSDNPAAARENYVSYVQQRLGIGADARLSAADAPRLAQAMREFETGSRETGTLAAGATPPERSLALGGDEDAGARAAIERLHAEAAGMEPSVARVADDEVPPLREGIELEVEARQRALIAQAIRDDALPDYAADIILRAAPEQRAAVEASLRSRWAEEAPFREARNAAKAELGELGRLLRDEEIEADGTVQVFAADGRTEFALDPSTGAATIRREGRLEQLQGVDPERFIELAGLRDRKAPPELAGKAPMGEMEGTATGQPLAGTGPQRTSTGADTSPADAAGAPPGQAVAGNQARRRLMGSASRPSAAAADATPVPRDRTDVRITSEELKAFDDVDGEGLRQLGESLEHDLRARAAEAPADPGLGTLGREAYKRQHGRMWLMAADELDDLFDQAKLSEAAQLARSIELIGLTPSPELAALLQRETFLWDRVAARIESEADAAGLPVPPEADRILNPRWDDPPPTNLPMSEDIAAMQRAVAAASDDDKHMLASEIGWALRGVDGARIKAVLAGEGDAQAQAAMMTVRLGVVRLGELGEPQAVIPQLIMQAMVRNGVRQGDAVELTGNLMTMLREAGGEPAARSEAAADRPALPPPGSTAATDADLRALVAKGSEKEIEAARMRLASEDPDAKLRLDDLLDEQWEAGAAGRARAAREAADAQADAVRLHLEGGGSVRHVTPRTDLTIKDPADARYVDGTMFLSERGKWVRLQPHELEKAAREAGWRPEEDGPASAAAAPAVAGRRGGRVTRRGPQHVLTVLGDAGGIRDTEGHSLLKGRNLQRFIPGAGPLIRKNGMTIDEAGELLWERGFFGPPTTTARPGEREVLELIEEATRRRVYTPEEAADVDAIAQRQGMSDQEAGWRDQAADVADEWGVRFDDDMVDEFVMWRARGEDADLAAMRAIETSARRTAFEGEAVTEADLDAMWGPFDRIDEDGLDRIDDAAGSAGADRPLAGEGGEPGLSGSDARARDAGGGQSGDDQRAAGSGGELGPFRLDPEGEPRTLDDILNEVDQEIAAAKALRDCL